ncbi:helix-turn-helix domain-containing protein [Maribacter polysiphoniae]|uniref:Helix-turn-helix domain-containing protein n=1 Tax=Maribacter polysiphoniae TaxID=429344 RepID=A0A316E8L7_9FLAO|nr:helix-turn-helix domain-containing protein [Maribacter polysiphoniae]MBD1262309.1 helix-turn-helix domain-containing protein [Maribacter polysiphoniae]PWK26008.1 helix-turn-helix protein [Maribacter polysiphoniae]
MKTVFHIKNMVCDRCKMIVSQSLEELGATCVDVELGTVTVASDTIPDYETMRQVLESKGFELIADKNEIIVERIKTNLIDFVDPEKHVKERNVSAFLSKALNRDYSLLSKLFSKTQGISIEKYVIHLKIEKVKEFIQMNNLGFSEVAYTMGYKSSSHLARQFKMVTGLSMSEYKNLQEWGRKSLDQIV